MSCDPNSHYKMFWWVTAILGLAPLVSSLYDTLSTHMLPCPQLFPQPDVDIDQLLGPWHLAMLLVDNTEEDFVESGVCVHGEWLRYNSSTVLQMWSMLVAGEPVAVIELPTSVVRPGVWAIQSPLGGELKAVVFESDPQAYILVCNCGWHEGTLVHLGTAAMTRSRVLSPKLRYYLTSLLQDHGLHSLHSKVVSWHGC